ncbi:hypothetical protein Z948_2809 [Sulfitobacter donghicola DSW-25 = KCTC 12864 = JCM 14565]|nr:hypothetical protein Z948_2809 [Sulfitobacter donghicola DSW-25 = KCTC 12864 = JCM 14565]
MKHFCGLLSVIENHPPPAAATEAVGEISDRVSEAPSTSPNRLMLP